MRDSQVPSLEHQLFAEPHRFDFFQAVRLLNRIDPAGVPVGYWGPPESESVRFRTVVSLSFPASAIVDLAHLDAARRVPVLTQAFFGLTGPSGVLPRHYTDLLIRLEGSKGPERSILRDWLDLFTHRLLSHFFRAWEKYRFPVAYERRDLGRGDLDPFTLAILSLVGVGTPSLRGRLVVSTGMTVEGTTTDRTLARVDDLALVYYAGLLSHRPRSAIGLEGIVGDYFGIPAEVSQFVGQWLVLDPIDQTRIGVVAGQNLLGSRAVVGEKVWDVQGKFRIRLGPLRYDQFVQFLPDRAPIAERKSLFLLAHLVRIYVGEDLDFDVQLVLRGDEVPHCVLEETEDVGPRLGWNTWLHDEPFDHDPDAVFEGQEVFRVD